MSSLAYPLGQDPNQPYAAAAASAAAIPGAASVATPLGAPAATSGLGALPAPTPGALLQPNPHPGTEASVVPKAMQLQRNPQLPAHPATVDPGAMDAQYQAEQAQIAAEISQRYNDVLKNLGYMDPSTGQFVMGNVETEANRQRAELGRSQGLAVEEQTKQRQLEGTLFSGRRGTEQARAEHPFVQSLADLDISVPQQLSDLYEQAGNLTSEYSLRNNLALAAAAQRRALAIQQTAAGGGDTGGPIDPNAPLPDPTPIDPNAPVPDPTAPGGGFMAPNAPASVYDPRDPANYYGTPRVGV